MYPSSVLARTASLLLAAGQGEVIGALGEWMTIKATAAQTSGTVSVLEFTLPAEAPGPPAHVHNTFDEAFYILEGTLVLSVDDGTRPLGPGGFAFVPRGTHTRSPTRRRSRFGFSWSTRRAGLKGSLVLWPPCPRAAPDLAAIGALGATYDSIVVQPAGLGS